MRLQDEIQRRVQTVCGEFLGGPGSLRELDPSATLEEVCAAEQVKTSLQMGKLAGLLSAELVGLPINGSLQVTVTRNARDPWVLDVCCKVQPYHTSNELVIELDLRTSTW